MFFYFCVFALFCFVFKCPEVLNKRALGSGSQLPPPSRAYQQHGPLRCAVVRSGLICTYVLSRGLTQGGVFVADRVGGGGSPDSRSKTCGREMSTALDGSLGCRPSAGEASGEVALGLVGLGIFHRSLCLRFCVLLRPFIYHLTRVLVTALTPMPVIPPGTK